MLTPFLYPDYTLQAGSILMTLNALHADALRPPPSPSPIMLSEEEEDEDDEEVNMCCSSSEGFATERAGV
jgi:hypothetical protein